VASRICKENGWDENSPQYRTANSKDPVEGLTYLYQEAAKNAATKAAEAAELKHKQAIKEAGGTGLAGGPSAGGTKTFTRAQIAKMSYTEYKANEKAIDEATRAGLIE